MAEGFYPLDEFSEAYLSLHQLCSKGRYDIRFAEHTSNGELVPVFQPYCFAIFLAIFRDFLDFIVLLFFMTSLFLKEHVHSAWRNPWDLLDLCRADMCHVARTRRHPDVFSTSPDIFLIVHYPAPDDSWRQGSERD